MTSHWPSRVGAAINNRMAPRKFSEERSRIPTIPAGVGLPHLDHPTRITTIPARVVGLWRRSLVCSRNECSLAMNSGYP